MTAAAAILLEGAKNDENCSMNATEHSKSFGVIPLQYVVSITEPVILKPRPQPFHRVFNGVQGSGLSILGSC